MILGHLRGARRRSRSRRWPSGSRRWPRVILKDPDVAEPVVVHRRRRHQHDAEQRPHPDQPQAARGARRERHATSSAGCSRSSPRSTGITLYMQPVQDLTVEDRVSRTQYQYSLEDADADGARRRGRRGCSSSCARCPSCATSPATSRTAGSQATLVIDRDTASRLGITPQMIDDTLYDAFGQRQVSTIFTQLNQYRVVLEVTPRVPAQSPEALKQHLRAVARPARRCRSSAVHALRADAPRRWRSTTRASSRR